MATRIVEWKKPYTWGKAISIDENKVISLNLRDENNLIIYDEWDDEIYVDLQLDDEITPTSAFPIWVNVGRVIVDNWWDLAWTIISAETTSGDNIKIFYADEWTLWIDNGTWTFKQIYFKADVDALLLALRNYIDWELAKKQNWVSSDTAPSNPSEWDLWYDTTNSAMKVWDWTAWQSVGTGWGWDVLVSSQPNNILQSWMKIRAWTEWDYGSLGVYDNNTVYLTVDWAATPWRHPWANTIAYYKFNGNSLDYSGNNYDITSVTSYDTLSSWIKVAYFSGKVDLFPWNCNTNLWYDLFKVDQDITISFYVKPSTASVSIYRFQWSSSYRVSLVDIYSDRVERGLWNWGYNIKSFSTSISTSAFQHIVLVYDHTAKTVSMYKNWTLVSSTSTSWYALFTDCTWCLVWYAGFDNDKSEYLSEMIFENKVRTAQEVSDYFDQTKWNYWIS